MRHCPTRARSATHRRGEVGPHPRRRGLRGRSRGPASPAADAGAARVVNLPRARRPPSARGRHVLLLGSGHLLLARRITVPAGPARRRHQREPRAAPHRERRAARGVRFVCPVAPVPGAGASQDAAARGPQLREKRSSRPGRVRRGGRGGRGRAAPPWCTCSGSFDHGWWSSCTGWGARRIRRSVGVGERGGARADGGRWSVERSPAGSDMYRGRVHGGPCPSVVPTEPWRAVIRSDSRVGAHHWRHRAAGLRARAGRVKLSGPAADRVGCCRCSCEPGSAAGSAGGSESGSECCVHRILAEALRGWDICPKFAKPFIGSPESWQQP